jgi:hypothetical protein
MTETKTIKITTPNGENKQIIDKNPACFNCQTNPVRKGESYCEGCTQLISERKE